MDTYKPSGSWGPRTDVGTSESTLSSRSHLGHFYESTKTTGRPLTSLFLLSQFTPTLVQDREDDSEPIVVVEDTDHTSLYITT